MTGNALQRAGATLLFAAVAGAATAAAPLPPLHLAQADFQAVAGDAPAGWASVALPDTWAARGLPRAGRGH